MRTEEAQACGLEKLAVDRNVSRETGLWRPLQEAAIQFIARNGGGATSDNGRAQRSFLQYLDNFPVTRPEAHVDGSVSSHSS
jgi:hypothetical protein